MPSNEFFVLHPDGRRTDAELHDPILAEGDVDRAKEVTRQRLRAKGYSEQRIKDFLDETPQTQGSGESSGQTE